MDYPPYVSDVDQVAKTRFGLCIKDHEKKTPKKCRLGKVTKKLGQKREPNSSTASAISDFVTISL